MDSLFRRHRRRFSSLLRLLLPFLGLAPLTFMVCPVYAQETTLRLATGRADGTYEVIARALIQAVEGSPARLRIQPLPAERGRIGPELLARGEADLVLEQSDVAGELERRALQEGTQSPWRLVLVLAQEPVQIVAGPSLRGDTLSQLSARPLALGPADSGDRFTAIKLLGALGIPHEEVPGETSADGAEALKSGRALAVIFVTGAPDPQVAALLSDPSYHLLSPDTQEMGVLHDTLPYYTTATIFENTYPNQRHPVETVSVLTVLLCRADLPDDVIRRLTSALLEAAAKPSSELGKQTRFNFPEILNLTEGAAVPTHPGAEQALAALPYSLRARAYVHWLQWVAFVGLAVLLLVAATLRRPRLAIMRAAARRVPMWLARLLRYLLFQRLLWQIIRTLSLFVLIWLVGSAVMYLFEHELNTNFSNLKVSSLSILVYLFSGLEDRAPVTNGGWIGSVVMLISGLLIAAYITGQFASEIMRHTFGVIQMTKNSAKGSMLIVGWNPRAERVVREMFGAFDVALPEHNVTVLSPERVDTSRFSEFETRGVTFVSGDAFDKKLLSRIGAHMAHSVIIMADTSTEDPDAVTTLTVLAVRSLCREEEVAEQERPRICAEVMNHRKMSLVRDAGADEVICHEDFGLGVLAQSAFSAKLTDVYQELLSYSVLSCEIYMLTSPHDGRHSDIPEDIWSGLFEGRSFVEASQIFNGNRDGENPPILIGVEQNGKVLINPRTPIKLRAGDSLIVIAYVRPRLDNLRHVRA